MPFLAPSRSATSRSTMACLARVLPCSPRMSSRVRSAIRARRSMTFSSSTSCLARRYRTSRSTPSPISATPPAVSSRRSIPETLLMPSPRSSGSRRIRAARPASSSCARPVARGTAARCSNTYAGSWCESATRRHPAPGDHVPRLPEAVIPTTLGDACPRIDVAAYDFTLAGGRYRFGDYAVGEKIDHIDGITVEEAEHQIATRLYQNTARIHFDQYSAAQGRFGRRLIYGGHVISLARALSFNGLANAFHIAAINS